MNNTKWREVFYCLIDNSVGGCIWRFTNEDKDYGWPLPHRGAVLECGIADGSWCPIEYKEIRWVIMPNEYVRMKVTGMKPWTKSNNLCLLKTKLDSIGLLDYEISDSQIKLFGYRIAG
jgi:hypothetical protein